MSRKANGSWRAIRRALLSLVLVAASSALWHAPEAGAQPRAPAARGLPMSQVLARSTPKVAGCIIPAPVISISPGSISFPTPVSAGACSTGTQSFTVTNSGTKSVYIDYLSLSPPGDPDPFSLSESCSEGTLAPSQSCSGTVQFCPYSGASPGTLTQQLIVHHDAGTNAIPLTGTVATPSPIPVFFVSPGSVDMGAVPLGARYDQAVTVENVGGASMSVTSVATAAPFSVYSNTCGTVPAGGSCQIIVSYNASTSPTSLESGTLVINHSAAGSPGTVNLYGQTVPLPGLALVTPPTGVVSTPLNIFVAQGDIGYGPVYFTNLTGSPLTIDDVALGSGGDGYFSLVDTSCFGLTLNPGLRCMSWINYDGVNAPVGTDSDTLRFLVGGVWYDASISVEVVPPYPQISITPNYLDYGVVNIGSQSTCQHIEFRNDGTLPAPFFLDGPYYGEFVGSSCTPPGPACTANVDVAQTLSPAESCFVSLVYAPLYAGQAYDYLYAIDGNSVWGYVAGASLTGFGNQPGPKIDVFPAGLSFGAHVIGTSAPNQSANFKNTGDADLTLSSFSGPGASGLSVVSDGCAPYPRVLAPDASCDVTFGFTAVLAFPISDSATMFSDAVNVPAPPSNGIAVFMDAEGVAAPTPSADFYPMQLAFGNVIANATSAAQSVSFANTGSGPMAISSIVPSAGDFLVTHDCPATLAANACCTITARFHPTIGGLQVADIEVTTDASGSPHLIPVQGTGIPPPSITKSPGAVTFPDQIIDTTGGPIPVVFTNTGITDVSLLGVTYLPAGGDFHAFFCSTCDGHSPAPAPPKPKAATMPGTKSSVVAAIGRPKASIGPCSFGTLLKGDSCYADVYFTPTALGLRTGTLSLAFSGGVGSPAIVPLAGNGIPVNFPAISVSASEVDFGGVVVATTSTRAVSVSSTGSGILTVSGVRTFGGIFSAATDCTSPLPPGSSCTVNVTCSPASLGPVDGDLYIDHDASGGFTYVRLKCTGANKPVPKIEVPSTSVGFGNQALGSTSGVQRVLIKSVGTAPLEVRGVSASSQFDAASDCPASLAPGLSCNANVTFTPSAPGRQRGVLGISSNDPERSTVPVDLSGGGCRPFSVQAARRGQNLCGP